MSSFSKSKLRSRVSDDAAQVLKGLGFPVQPSKDGGGVQLDEVMAAFYKAYSDDLTVQYLDSLMDHGFTLERALEVLNIPSKQLKKFTKLIQKFQKQKNK